MPAASQRFHPSCSCKLQTSFYAKTRQSSVSHDFCFLSFSELILFPLEICFGTACVEIHPLHSFYPLNSWYFPWMEVKVISGNQVAITLRCPIILQHLSLVRQTFNSRVIDGHPETFWSVREAENMRCEFQSSRVEPKTARTSHLYHWKCIDLWNTNVGAIHWNKAECCCFFLNLGKVDYRQSNIRFGQMKLWIKKQPGHTGRSDMLWWNSGHLITLMDGRTRAGCEHTAITTHHLSSWDVGM